MSYIICTDLDGTLLDHYNYSWTAAEPAMRLAQEKNIPIVINTSKTAPEVHALQRTMCINEAFIVENGSAIYIPKNIQANVPNDEYSEEDYEIVLLGANRAKIVDFLQSLRDEKQYTFESYSDWDINKLIDHTGLDQSAASLSLARQYSEPLLWFDTELHYSDFVADVAQQGLKILKGGRFIHVLGQTNKGKAIKYFLSECYGGEAKVIALGDSYNDVDMLEVADFPAWVKSPTNEFPPLQNQNIQYSSDFGPSGWNELVQKIINS